MTEEMIRLFNEFKGQVDNFFLIVLTPREVESIRAGLISSGLDENEILVRTAEPGDVPAYLSVASIAVSLIKPCFSKLSSSPTKLAEYLLAGVPVVVNKGIGDVDELVNGNEVGIVLDTLDHDSLAKGVARSIKLASEPGVRERCRRVAEEQFGLEEVGGPFYRRIYSDLGPTTNTD